MQEIIDPSEVSNGRLPVALPQGQTIQQVRTAFCTAVSVQKARNIPDVKRRLLEEARLMGEDAYYGWGAGKSAIEGPSIDLAVAAARCWGNCATDMMPVQDLPDCWIFSAAFIDLETGYTRTRQFRQSKNSAVHGKHDDERKDDIRFQIGQSKAERNVILKALPSWLINAALEAAKEGVRAELENLTRKHGVVHIADRLVNAILKCGAKEAAILAKCGVVERKGLTVDHLVILRGDLHALQTGQERVEVLFPAPAETLPPSEPDLNAHWKKPLEGVAESLRQQEAAVETKPEEKPRRKITKKTLALLIEWATKVQLTPIEKEEFCVQEHVERFEDLSDESAQRIIHDLRESWERKEAAKQVHDEKAPEREPGVDEDEDWNKFVGTEQS